ncbi:MAG TPA: anthranilate synthase component I [Acidobacteriaceae bacterium]|nr:anthranilate synthase component I [Acidobacteriaceae bacterium]
MQFSAVTGRDDRAFSRCTRGYYGWVTYFPEPDEFAKLAASHTLIPVYATLTADLETPVSAFLRVAADEPEAFLLESVEGGEKIGRYTFIGIRPYRKIIARGREIEVLEGKSERRFTGDAFAVLKDALGGHTPARLAGLPPFTAGAVGYFAYDAVRLIENLPTQAKDEIAIPDAVLMFFDTVLAFDHVKKEILLIASADVRETKVSAAYSNAVQRIKMLEKRLAMPLPKQQRAKTHGPLKVIHRTRKPDFLSAVEKIKDYITAGDAFQVVLSQRFDVEPGVDPFAVYRALRIVNPSPYLYYLRMGKTHIVGSSPEMLVRVTSAEGGSKIEYRPIAGTRPRSADEVEDARLAEEMRGDEKEVAEHVMLVDLGRNDVGRVSEYGSVKVREQMAVERYSHVMHLVSAIEGKLRKELSAVDALRACFPAGTLSGAPKVRAMEIIEELEPARRGLYGGSVLYADFSGNLNSCIAIRSMLVDGKRGYIQAGAGIVADSVPEKEFEECVNKAQAVVRAVERARNS